METAIIIFVLLALLGAVAIFLLQNLGIALVLVEAALVAFLVRALVKMFAKVVLDAWIEVPAAHFGVVQRFGRRTGRIMDEGLHKKWPLVEKVTLISNEMKRIPIKMEFTTADKLTLILEASVKYIPDWDVKDGDGQNVFFGISDEVIEKGIKEAIESKIVAFGGTRKHKEFISSLNQLSDFINGMLRLSQAPHLAHKMPCEVVAKGGKCGLPEQVPAKDLIGFYKNHREATKKALDSEKKNKNDRSPTEQRYGIDIEIVELLAPKFTAETQKVFESKKQAEAKQDATDSLFKLTERLKKEVGLSEEKATNVALLIMNDKVSMEIIKSEGGSAPIIVKNEGGK